MKKPTGKKQKNEKMTDATRAGESKYLNADLVKESPTKRIAFTNAGEYVIKKDSDGNDYEKLELGIMIDGKAKIYAPTKDSAKNLINAWGAKTEKWIGCTADVRAIKMMGKDSVMATPSGEKV